MKANDRNTPGRVPFGYRLRGSEVEPDPSEAGVVQLAFELFAEHGRKKTVARMLVDAGHRTRRGAPFSDSSVSRLLRAPYGPTSPDDSKSPFPPLVPADLWRRCNEILEGQEASRSKRSRKPSQPFAGTAECACGSKMYVPSNSPKYVCRSCRNKIPIEDLDALFHRQLEEPLSQAWTDLAVDEKATVVENVAQRIVVGDGSVTFEIRYLSLPSEILATGQRNGPNRNAHESTGTASHLADRVVTVFHSRGVDRLFSADLAETLGGTTQRRLASDLRPLGIRSQNIRIGKTVKKGYLLEWFEEAPQISVYNSDPPRLAASPSDGEVPPAKSGEDHGH
jgi:hypothetical protein